MTYIGGKNGAGIAQRIINQMPPHKVYVELFLGSGAILRNKRPAARNIGMDLSKEAIEICRDLMPFDPDDFLLSQAHSLEWLELSEAANLIERDWLLYADPPYLMETRKGGPLYDFEMSDADHERLLRWAVSTRAMVMISGYRSALYDRYLAGWTRIDYQASTRQGMVEECLWMNFKQPAALHDYSHLGEDFRERERIKRKKARWTTKLAKMNRLERLALMDALTNTKETQP